MRRTKSDSTIAMQVMSVAPRVRSIRWVFVLCEFRLCEFGLCEFGFFVLFLL